MNDATPSTQTFAATAEIARTLGHEHRLALLEQISQGERAVERLAELCGLSVANTSQHLQHLRRSGFVQTRRDGKRVLYRLGSGPIANLLGALRQYVEHNRSEIRELIVDSVYQRDRVELISREELLLRMQEGSVTLIDVRPEEEFALGHLPGAINLSVEELERRCAEFPPDQEIVAYCRGPYCVMSFDAVAALRAKGLRARRLESGFPEWKAAGLRVETTK
ncbi:metalloregulator ArsR/SmtB family transcription factor [Pseudomonas sp. CrR25]|nr:metalloregulator ArsR/SmtB family transcription factor [Pseudomonas sp. CrR25]